MFSFLYLQGHGNKWILRLKYSKLYPESHTKFGIIKLITKVYIFLYESIIHYFMIKFIYPWLPMDPKNINSTYLQLYLWKKGFLNNLISKNNPSPIKFLDKIIFLLNDLKRTIFQNTVQKFHFYIVITWYHLSFWNIRFNGHWVIMKKKERFNYKPAVKFR